MTGSGTGAGDAGRAEGAGASEPDPSAGLPQRELTVESVAVGGDGVAREESGRVVFVPRTAPGDRVRARIVRDEGSYVRAELAEVMEAGDGRRDPPCPYYADCGGCQLQHLDMGTQRRAKRDMVRDTLRRIGGRDVEVSETVPSARTLGYRNRVTLTLRREGSRIRAGYHRRAAPGRIVDVETCPLAEDPVNRAWRQIRAAWGDGADRLPAGRSLRITVRASARGRVSLLVEQEDPPAGPPDAAPGDPEAIAGAVEGLSGYFWRPRGEKRRRLAGAPRMPEEWQGVELELPPEVFLQVNRGVARSMEGHLDRRIREQLGGAGGRRILDLYAGVGLRALRWAEAGADAAACERDEAAVEAGRAAARRRGAEPELRAATVEACLDDLLPADLAVVNPPRSGLSGEVAARLADSELGHLGYVSCDPATLARDLERLGEAWTVVSVQPFDAFPQTAHIETIAWLRRGPASADRPGAATA